MPGKNRRRKPNPPHHPRQQRNVQPDPPPRRRWWPQHPTALLLSALGGLAVTGGEVALSKFTIWAPDAIYVGLVAVLLIFAPATRERWWRVAVAYLVMLSASASMAQAVAAATQAYLLWWGVQVRRDARGSRGGRSTKKDRKPPGSGKSQRVGATSTSEKAAPAAR